MRKKNKFSIIKTLNRILVSQVGKDVRKSRNTEKTVGCDNKILPNINKILYSNQILVVSLPINEKVVPTKQFSQ